MSDQVSKKRKTLNRARELRTEATDAESRLWAALRSHPPGGLKFRRQQAFAPYILDFYCHALRLVIEIDGGQHFDAAQAAYDARRSAFLQEKGLKVLRFDNLEVLQNLEGVMARIVEVVEEGPSPQPSPVGRGS